MRRNSSPPSPGGDAPSVVVLGLLASMESFSALEAVVSNLETQFPHPSRRGRGRQAGHELRVLGGGKALVQRSQQAPEDAHGRISYPLAETDLRSARWFS